MARSPARLAIDAALVACAILACVDRTPEVPSNVCEGGAGGPDYATMLGDGRLTVAAVFGEIEGAGAADHAAWSADALAQALEQRGFLATEPNRYELGNVRVDLVGPIARDDRAALDDALAGAFAHDVVYYNGHDYRGALALDAPTTGYRVVVLDSCWSTQRYSARLLAPTVDVVGNTERAVTGSVESFAAFLDGLRAHASWHALLAPMNELAEARAHARPVSAQLVRPEHYRHDVACASGSGQRPAQP